METSVKSHILRSNTHGALHFDPYGYLHIVSYDSSIHAVNIFTPEGEYLQSYGRNDLTDPTAIAIDEEGYSFIVENRSTNSCRLQIFDPQHNLIKSIKGYNYSQGITISGDGSILIGDRNNIHKC